MSPERLTSLLCAVNIRIGLDGPDALRIARGQAEVLMNRLGGTRVWIASPPSDVPVADILRMRQDGRTITEIAAKTGMSRTAVHRVLGDVPVDGVNWNASGRRVSP